jgi:hypothetical protein
VRIAQFVGPSLVVVLISACVAATPGPASAPPNATTAKATAVASLQPSAPVATPTGPPVTASPEPTPSEEPEVTTEPARVEPSLPPWPGAPRLAGIVSLWQGGCASLYDRTELVGADACGPFEFDPLLASTPMRVDVAARLVLRSPPGASYSGAAAGIDAEWTVRIAPAAALAGLEESGPDGMPTGTGTIPLHGLGPDTAIIVTAPAKPGLWVVQVMGPVTDGRWTWTESVYYWLVRTV